MSFRRLLPLLFTTFFTTTLLFAQDSVRPAATSQYTTIVVFGDSLSDTGNDAAISAGLYTVNAQVPGPATGYTNGRFTDGTDTIPAARNYNGVWIEQLAAMFANKPAVTYSLGGGNNHAYGFATTNTGTTNFTYGPGNILSFNVENMQQQVADYLATKPVINSSTLFVVWGGANDLIAATSTADITNAAARDVGIIQTLITAGATDFIVPNLPPLGLVPRYNGSPTTANPVNAAAQGYDLGLVGAIGTLAAANAGKVLRIYQLDTFTLFNTIVAAPAVKNFANITASAQFNTTINPDTYLFWDDLHPTTYGHSLIAQQANTLLTGPVSTTLVLSGNNAGSNLNSAVTFTAAVTGASGTPIGSVNFLDGTALLGSVYPTGPAFVASAAFTTSALTAGLHTITAQFVGVNGYSSSSSTLSQTVLPPALASAIQYSTLTIKGGSSGTTQFSAIPSGGFTGTATFACTGLPAHMSCSFSPTTATLAANTAVQTTLTIATNIPTTSLLIPISRSLNPIYACGLPLAMFSTMLLLARRRRNPTRHARLVLLLLAFASVSLGLAGCGGVNNNTPSGTYNLQVTATSGSSTTTQALSITVQ